MFHVSEKLMHICQLASPKGNTESHQSSLPTDCRFQWHVFQQLLTPGHLANKDYVYYNEQQLVNGKCNTRLSKSGNILRVTDIKESLCLFEGV